MAHPHILLISLETIRRDHLRCHGYQKDLAPHLDRLARGGVWCTDAVSNCGWTLPQNITLHTGLYPLTHDLTLLREQHPLSSEHTLLAEHLKALGYRTFAGVNKANPYSAHERYGFGRGFDEFDAGAEYNQHMDYTAEFVVRRFKENHADAPCFMYVHVNDTHEPWDAPQPWRNMWGDSYHSLYEGDITYTDHYLGKVFSSLEELGLLEEMLIVVAGDHGTEFWEHGFIEKKINLYNEILQVPLLFHCPARLPADRPLPGLAESAQIAPTVVEIADLPPLPGAQGKSLLPRIRGEEADGLNSVCSHTRHEHQGGGGAVQFDHYAIQTLTHKFIRLEVHIEPEELHSDWLHRMRTIMVRARRDPAELEAGTVIRELYDLNFDPKEEVNLLPGGAPKDDHAKEVAEDLETKLDAWIQDCVARRAS